VGEGTTVGVSVAVSVGVGVGVGVGVEVAFGVAVGGGVAVKVGVAVAAGTGVSAGSSTTSVGVGTGTHPTTSAVLKHSSTARVDRSSLITLPSIPLGAGRPILSLGKIQKAASPSALELYARRGAVQVRGRSEQGRVLVHP